MLYLGMSMQASGQAQAAERLLLDEYESYGDKTDVYALFLLESLCFIYLNTGQLEQTRQIAQVLLQGVNPQQDGNHEELGRLVSRCGVLSTQ